MVSIVAIQKEGPGSSPGIAYQQENPGDTWRVWSLGDSKSSIGVNVR